MKQIPKSGFFLPAAIWRELALLSLVVLLVTVPFLAKPVHMDGIYFLEFAEVKQQSPWQDSLPNYEFGGEHFERFRDTHPPFTAYYLALVLWLTGSSNEILLHLAFLPFALLAAIAAYFLARRFVSSPLFAALLVVAGPGFVVMSSDLMSDLPVMAFWLAAVAAFIFGVDRGRKILLVLAGAFSFLAFFTAYEALSLIPLLLLYLLLFRKFTWRNILPLVGASLLLFAYLGGQWLWQGELPRLKVQHAGSIAGPGISRFFAKAASLMLFLGGTVVFPPAILAIFWPRREQAWDYVSIVFLFALFPVLLAWRRVVPWGQALQMALLLPCAGLLLWGFVERVLKRDSDATENLAQREWIFLSLWFAGVVFYIVTVLHHASVKYLLVALFPVAILLAGQVRQRFGVSRLAAIVKAATIVTTIVLSVLVGAADYQLAAAYRDFGVSLESRASGGANTWFTGEFAFRYYLKSKDWNYLLANDQRPQAGDMVIQPILPGPVGLSEQFSGRLELIEERVLAGQIPIRIINPPAGAGFYGHRWGLLPYSWSDNELDHIFFYRIKPKIS